MAYRKGACLYGGEKAQRVHDWLAANENEPIGGRWQKVKALHSSENQDEALAIIMELMLTAAS